MAISHFGLSNKHLEVLVSDTAVRCLLAQNSRNSRINAHFVSEETTPYRPLNGAHPEENVTLVFSGFIKL
jgi:hypothetical protein